MEYPDKYILYYDHDFICKKDPSLLLPTIGVNYFAATPEFRKTNTSYYNAGVMVWSYQYLLLGLFGHTPSLCYCVKAFARLTGFWLKYFDHLELSDKYASDGTSVTFFMSKKL